MLSSSFNPECISVYVIHSYNKKNMYLLLRRCGKYLHGTWQMISGGIKEGEKAYDAALREIHEETGLIPDRLYCADAVETFYMKSQDKILFVPVFVAFIDRLNADVELSLTEHDDYEWVAIDVAQQRLEFSEQKRVLSHIHKNFVLNDPKPLHSISNF